MRLWIAREARMLVLKKRGSIARVRYSGQRIAGFKNRDNRHFVETSNAFSSFSNADRQACHLPDQLDGRPKKKQTVD